MHIHVRTHIGEDGHTGPYVGLQAFFPLAPSFTSASPPTPHQAAPYLLGSLGSWADSTLSTVAATSQSLVTSHKPSVPRTSTSSGQCSYCVRSYTRTWEGERGERTEV